MNLLGLFKNEFVYIKDNFRFESMTVKIYEKFEWRDLKWIKNLLKTI